MRNLAAIAVTGLLAAACGSEPPKGPVDRRGSVTVVALASFEVRDDQVDRFEHCPPAGEIGQDWLPPIPEWHPPAASASAAVPESAVDSSGSGGKLHADERRRLAADYCRSASPGVFTDEAATCTTRAGFRHCYHGGLLYDPTQDGRVGRGDARRPLRPRRGGRDLGRLRPGPHGARVPCMRDVASRVRLHPPADGSATVTVPALFTSDTPAPKAPNDAYAAAAYVAVESMRPRLHNCVDTARRAGASVLASADDDRSTSTRRAQERAHRRRPVEGRPRAARVRGRGAARRALPEATGRQGPRRRAGRVQSPPGHAVERASFRPRAYWLGPGSPAGNLSPLGA